MGGTGPKTNNSGCSAFSSGLVLRFRLGKLDLKLFKQRYRVCGGDGGVFSY